MLQGLDLCPPVEMITDYTLMRLDFERDTSRDLDKKTYKMVEGHISRCQDCREEFEESYANIPKEYEMFCNSDFGDLPDVPTEIPQKLRDKIDLVAKINSCRSKIAEGIARVLLPKDKHALIAPAIVKINAGEYKRQY